MKRKQAADVLNFSQPHSVVGQVFGNVRSVITPDANNNPVVTQANDYFPGACPVCNDGSMSFESPIPHLSYKSTTTNNKHKYNGKEEQEMPGKWLDYGFRFYDPQIARFHAVDPLATKNHQQTPYAYAMNNPLRYIDWLGLDTLSVTSPEPVKKDDVVVMDDGSTATANTDEVVVSPDKSSSDDQKSEETEAFNIKHEAIQGPEFTDNIWDWLNKINHFGKRTWTDPNTGQIYYIDDKGNIIGVAPTTGIAPSPGGKGKQTFIKGIGLVKNNILHHIIKPKILKAVGKRNFAHVVGKNPNVAVENGKIILQGTGANSGKIYRTELDVSNFFGN